MKLEVTSELIQGAKLAKLTAAKFAADLIAYWKLRVKTEELPTEIAVLTPTNSKYEAQVLVELQKLISI